MAYALRVRHPALFMEMRLGKTLVVIRTCQLYASKNQDQQRFLVVAPNSALGSWEHELSVEDQKFLRLQGTTKQRREQLHGELPRWILINREAWRWLPEIADLPWDVVILDESTCIKNPKAGITKFFLKHFRYAQHRWILSGKPNPESDLELFTQLQFLDNQAFGFRNFWVFRQKHCEQTDYDWELTKESASKVQDYMNKRAFVMRRQDAGLDVNKIYERRYLDLPTKLKASYKQAEEEYVLELAGTEVTRTIWETVKYQWLRQLCGGFVDHKLVWSGKLDELKELLTGELSDQQVVVWFDYNQEATHANWYLREAEIDCVCLTGQDKVGERIETFQDFQAGKHRVLLLQARIAQMGTDLSAADTAIYYSTPLSAEIRQQTEDRIIKPGKTGVLILDLAIRDTVDQDGLDALRHKKWRSDKLLRIAAEYAQARHKKISV